MQLERLPWTCRDVRRIDCPLCGASEHVPLVVEHGLTIGRCPRCDLVFVNPQPTGDELQRFYAQYFPPESSPLWARQMGQVLRREGRNVLLRHRPVGRVLDVGCGFGFFLAVMRDAGWQAVGIEPSPTAASWARETLGLDVRTGRLETAELCPQSFDAVTLWYVLEHVPNPREVLSRCVELLRPGGVLIARVPNNNILIDRVLARLGRVGRRFYLMNPPRHLFDYSAVTLSRLMRKTGLRVRAVRNATPRATGTVLQLLRRLGWYAGAEALRLLLGDGCLFGSSITVYARKVGR